MLQRMISEGYCAPPTIERRNTGMEEWLANPELLEEDANSDLQL